MTEMVIRHRRQITGAFIFGMAGILLVGLLWLLVQTYETSAAIRETQETNLNTFSTIEDCTTPGRECFDAAQERQREAINDVNQVSIIAASCADKEGNQDVASIQKCVVAELRKADQ